MNTQAYDRNLPCLNPNCKSHGKPHPNCRCYGMAHGGAVEHFCSSRNTHQSDCQYYWKGDEVIDPNEVVSDKQSQGTINPSEVIPDEKINPEEVQLDKSPGGDGIDPLGTYRSFVQGMAESVGGNSGKAFMGSMGNATFGPVRLGSTPEEVELNEKQHPIANQTGRVVGQGIVQYGAGTAAKAVLGVERLALGTRALLNTAIAFSSRFGDEAGNYLMGVGGDPKTVASKVIAGTAADALFTTGIDLLASSVVPSAAVNATKKIVEGVAEKPLTAAAGYVASKYGVAHSGDIASYAHKAVENTLEHPILTSAGLKIFNHMFGGTISKVSSAIGKAKAFDARLGQALVGGLQKSNYLGLNVAADIAKKVAAGEGVIGNGVRAIFKGAGEADIIKGIKDEARDHIQEWIDSGGIDNEIQQDAVQPSVEHHAFGGAVGKQDKIALGLVYPEINALLNETKGRVSNYLKGIKPGENALKLPYDRPANEREKERQYKTAIYYAAHPVSILNKVNNGTLTPNDMKHFTSMFPDLYSHISAEMTKHVINSQVKKESLPYKKRQALSLFLGTALDTTFTPQAIQATQAVYAMKQQPGPTPKMAQGNLSKLAPSSLTSEQARVQRQQNQRS